MRPEDLKRQEEKMAQDTRNRLRKELKEILQRMVKSNEITSQGGEFKLVYYKPEQLPIIKEFFAEQGWYCTYNPRTESSWSMTAKSEHYYTQHFFTLRPLSEK